MYCNNCRQINQSGNACFKQNCPFSYGLEKQQNESVAIFELKKQIIALYSAGFAKFSKDVETLLYDYISEPELIADFKKLALRSVEDALQTFTENKF